MPSDTISLAVDLLLGTLRGAAPLAAVSLAGLLYYRLGTINVALDGQIQAAAIAYVLVTGTVGGVAGHIAAFAVAAAVGALFSVLVSARGASDLLVGLGLLYIAGAGAEIASWWFRGNPGNAMLVGARIGDGTALSIVWGGVAAVVFAERRIRMLRVAKVFAEAPQLARLEGLSAAWWAQGLNIGASVLLGLTASFLVEFGNGFTSGISGGRGFLALAVVAVSQHSAVRALGWALAFSLAQKFLSSSVRSGSTEPWFPGELYEAALYGAAVALLVLQRLRAERASVTSRGSSAATLPLDSP